MELTEPTTMDVAQQEPRPLQNLRITWARYWSDVDLFWRPILEAFQRGDRSSYEGIEDDCVESGVHHVISGNLCAIRAALRGMICACDDESSSVEKRALFDALLHMVRPGKYKP